MLARDDGNKQHMPDIDHACIDQAASALLLMLFCARKALYPKLGLLQVSTAQSEDEDRWRRWVDDRLVRLLTVNIYRTAGESWQTFKYITDSSCNFGFLEAEAARVVGASMMYGISGRLRKKYDINGDVREELYKAADSWADAVNTSR